LTGRYRRIADDLSRVVSELVTNTVQPARTPLVLATKHQGSTLAVAVGDGLPSTPWLAEGAGADRRPRNPPVCMVAADRVVVRTGLGKTVWVSLKVRS
jgi:hypothetical protein